MIGLRRGQEPFQEQKVAREEKLKQERCPEKAGDHPQQAPPAQLQGLVRRDRPRQEVRGDDGEDRGDEGPEKRADHAEPDQCRPADEEHPGPQHDVRDRLPAELLRRSGARENGEYRVQPGNHRHDEQSIEIGIVQQAARAGSGRENATRNERATRPEDIRSRLRRRRRMSSGQTADRLVRAVPRTVLSMVAWRATTS
jgi:hypothetical protein